MSTSPDEARDLARTVLRVVGDLDPAEARAGFLFGIVIGIMRLRGLSDAGIRAEVLRGLDEILRPELEN